VQYDERPDGSWTKTGFACGTCIFFVAGYCFQHEVLTHVQKNGCCCRWSGKTSFSP
jgi:hypothetical protein